MSLSQGDITASAGYKATYVASWSSFTPAQAFFSIQGSATKIVKVLRIGFSGTQTTASTIIPVLTITDALFPGVGVSVAPTGIVPFDSNSPAATATPRTYTANTTGGGAVVGFIKNVKFTVPVAAAASAGQNEYIFNFTSNFSQDVVIRGTSEVVSLTLLGVTLTGGSTSIWVEWTEE